MNQCKVCGCTEDRACQTEGLPCSWLDERPDLCTACVQQVIQLPPELLDVQQFTDAEREQARRRNRMVIEIWLRALRVLLLQVTGDQARLAAFTEMLGAAVAGEDQLSDEPTIATPPQELWLPGGVR